MKKAPGSVFGGSFGGGDALRRVLLGKNLLDGLGGASCSVDLGCCGIVSASGSSWQKNGDATLVPSKSRDVSLDPSSETVV